jgi:hypothetical protein
MPITHTNRKGKTYTLCRGTTKTGKPRYSFVRDPGGRTVVEELPEGYEISESVNGVVSLAKKRPSRLMPGEIAAVEEAVRRHPRARDYRVSVKHDRIEVYESTGPDADAVLSIFAEMGPLPKSREAGVRAVLEGSARFSPVLRFTLQDEEGRDYLAERWCYLGSVDGWLFVDVGPVEQLARRMVPRLGTDAFFEL